jgi:hypothetical protein
VVAVGGAAWGQIARAADAALPMVDAAVTPKIVLPASSEPIASEPPSPKPVPPAVVSAAQNNHPIQPTQAARKTRFDVVPDGPGVVQVSQKSSLQSGRATSRFVPALRPKDAKPAVPLVGTPEPSPDGPVLVPHPEPSTSVTSPVQLEPRSSPTVPAVSQNVPAPPVTVVPPPETGGLSVSMPGASCSVGPNCCGPHVVSGHKPMLHSLLAWFTYCPKSCCTHPFGPAPYEPPIYTFFLCNGHCCSAPAPYAHAEP